MMRAISSEVLKVLPGGGNNYYLESTAEGVYDVQLKLPEGIMCTQCILQVRGKA